ncbi:unnamed protein product [Schistosoma bovis]|nr:unnamed protein product [Schistosoma bovis]
MDPSFMIKLNNIAEKYNYEFRDCDIVDLTEFSVTKTGDFLSSLPDSILSDDENDCDIENIQPSTNRTGSFTNTTIVGTCSDTEKEEENEEEEEEDEKEVTMESSLFNENSKMDFNNVKAALCCKYEISSHKYLIIYSIGKISIFLGKAKIWFTEWVKFIYKQ